jgi:aminopeptidase N
MAVAPYHTLERTSNGIPVQWAAMAIDTNQVLATFANLDTTLASFISSYGPYPFDKVGYCLVPFNSGAMEHASSIHIGRAFVNGSQTYATLWAHELAHMWWGDKVTCETAEDMWLNEGFASYNEAYYTQIVSGEIAYRDWIRTNHRKVLQFAHTPAQDGSYLTMNNIPHTNTYGYHVYQKGANLVHTLKNYMGEQEFYVGSQAYMNNRAYSHASSYDLRDELTNGSGVDMTRFFDDWIFTPGFPHFSIDSVVYIPGGLDHYFVYTRQRNKGNNHLYEMPIELNFTDGVTDTTVRVVIDSTTNMFHVPLYFYATNVFLDRYGKVSDARVSNEKIITATGNQTINETGVTLNVQSLSTPSSLLRIEHNFVPPDPFIASNPGIRLSDYRYWKVDGIFQPGFVTKCNFVYDGSTSASTGYLDNTFITGSEDSLVILYRQGPGYDWTVVNSFTRNTGVNLNDKRGSITVDTLMIGEYSLGFYDYTVGIPDSCPINNVNMNVSPNPSKEIFNFTFSKGVQSESQLVVLDMGGRIVYTSVLTPGSTTAIWNNQRCAPGFYYAVLLENGIRKEGVKLVVEH